VPKCYPSPVPTWPRILIATGETLPQHCSFGTGRNGLWSPNIRYLGWSLTTYVTIARLDTKLTSKQQGTYAGHPALHVTPNSIILIGGQLGFHRIYAQRNAASEWDFSHVEHVTSSEEDAALLQFSSQGRCSRLWWGNTGRPWHRLVTSPHIRDDGELCRDYDESLGSVLNQSQ
jgi:hypothetical protein